MQAERNSRLSTQRTIRQTRPIQWRQMTLLVRKRRCFSASVAQENTAANSTFVLYLEVASFVDTVHSGQRG
jgi:hypothetical protein